MRGSKRFNPSELIGPIVVVILAGSIVVTFIIAILLVGNGTKESDVEQIAAEQPPSATDTAATSVEIKMVPPLKFDIDQIKIAANEDVEITAANEDGSIPHNFSIYQTQDDYRSGGVDTVLFTTAVCSACTEAIVVNLSANEYFFQCDVHPDTMVGTVTVQ